jgi:hypothetical protein
MTRRNSISGLWLGALMLTAFATTGCGEKAIIDRSDPRLASAGVSSSSCPEQTRFALNQITNVEWYLTIELQGVDEKSNRSLLMCLGNPELPALPKSWDEAVPRPSQWEGRIPTWWVTPASQYGLNYHKCLYTQTRVERRRERSVLVCSDHAANIEFVRAEIDSTP